MNKPGKHIRPTSPSYPTHEAHLICTLQEYLTMDLQGWHLVHPNIDGFGHVGVRFGAMPRRDESIPEV